MGRPTRQQVYGMQIRPHLSRMYRPVGLNEGYAKLVPWARDALS